MKIRLVAIGLMGTLALAGCADSNVVDGKDIIEVPMPTPTPAATCNLLEVERISGATGEEAEGDNYMCVSKKQWDRNHVDEELVDENGKVIK